MFKYIKKSIKKIIYFFLQKIVNLLKEDKFILAKLYEDARWIHLNVYQSEIKEKYNIHNSVRFSLDTHIYGDGYIAIGENTYLGESCFLQSQAPGKIIIGKGCALAHNIHIRTSDFQKTFSLQDARKLPSSIKDIIIGDDVWIGANVYICGGVTIGNNVVVGANSIVTKDIPDNMVVGGVPARIIYSKSIYEK
jgi:maltose O-acetyltransferase